MWNVKGIYKNVIGNEMISDPVCPRMGIRSCTHVNKERASHKLESGNLVPNPVVYIVLQ